MSLSPLFWAWYEWFDFSYRSGHDSSIHRCFSLWLPSPRGRRYRHGESVYALLGARQHQKDLAVSQGPQTTHTVEGVQGNRNNKIDITRISSVVNFGFRVCFLFCFLLLFFLLHCFEIKVMQSYLIGLSYFDLNVSVR